MVILKCCIEAKGLLKAQAMITTVIYQRWCKTETLLLQIRKW